MSSPPCPPATSGIDNFHPLEVIPYFRRWKHGMVRDLLYTLIWNCVLGLAFWAIGGMFRPQNTTLAGLLMSLIMANSVGYTLHGIFLVSARLGLDTWARGFGYVATAAYYTLVSTLGVFLGFAIVALAFEEGSLAWMLQPRWIASLAVSSAIISIMIAMIYFAREKHARAEAELQRERVRVERVERDAALANLRALQAQIEPHFLFNTLANVASLVDPDPAMAKRMLESFIRFLRASLAATRLDSTTLGDEAGLIASYLQVLQVRMGGRLTFRIEVDPALAAFELAPMLLQPVVENAIRHGLEPKVEGGEVTFRARREGAQVVIEIADTGVGFASTTRGGVGLANLRDRLKLLYSGGASMHVGENSPSGARVTVRLPA
ncbi:MAG: histidine kinase [Pseudomonadota bacterium]|nr:histidine kinase [Pseudomonadota bacterium]